MKLDEIQSMWDEDCKIDDSELGTAALNISKLHARYFRIFTDERMRLHTLESQLRKLRLAKYEFYTQGPTKETHALGWELPPSGKILKADVGMYIEADDDIMNLTTRVQLQKEKLELLESIIKSLNSRGYNIKVAVDWIKFQTGA